MTAVTTRRVRHSLTSGATGLLDGTTTLLGGGARLVLQGGLGRRLGLPDADWHLTPEDTDSGMHGGDDEAGPITDDEAARLRDAPHSDGGPVATSLRYVLREGDLVFANADELGEVWRSDLAGGPGRIVVVSNPAHIKSLMTASPDIAPSATRFSPLRPIIGPNSVLTSIGPRHKQQRGLLLPQFHGRAVAAYQDRIVASTARRIDEWVPGEPVRLADLGQQITLDVIMSAVFGIEEVAYATPSERAVRESMVRLLHLSTHPLATIAQLLNSRSREPKGLLRWVLEPLDDAVYRVIAERRAEGAGGADGGGRTDIMTVLMAARGDDGNPLSDSEIRDELLTLVLAGHETTSNTVAWTFERLTRHPDVYAQAVQAARGEDSTYIDAVINESMRSRPVVPVVARELLRPWRFGSVSVDPGVVALVNILLLHHRDDLYPKPFAFDPERFVGVKPSPHQLMPFGGGNRRCLGSGLAMVELKVVVTEILRRVDLATTAAAPERPRHRNVTMIPGDGGLVTALARH
ncbi:cytochrome P450 [Tsukamurella sp. 8F]|uniref:cytochrome P450 n=1 Tax=unclassified Tsukamurella TaxID=2633480 RepID=UPI0023BA386E|nr:MULTISPECIES: cytochrome P450 [unclassified Tsukamurella]MDF0528790.1 cytochrome P450 [Tsukamurella sp. 8J]MDF0586625.1 cytochrome P450 [Tsukamurella sp. 8F]